MLDVLQSVSKIAEILLPVLERKYKNANNLFENYITPAREQAKEFSDKYLITFEKLLNSSLETRKDVSIAIKIVNESSRSDHGSRRSFITYSEELKNSFENQIINSEYREAAHEFYICITQIFLGQCEHQILVGTPYTVLFAKLNLLERGLDDEELRQQSVERLRGFCEWGINNQTTFMAMADKAFFKYKAALAPTV